MLDFNSLKHLALDVHFVKRLLKDSTVVEVIFFLIFMYFFIAPVFHQVTEDNKLRPKENSPQKSESCEDCTCFVVCNIMLAHNFLWQLLLLFCICHFIAFISQDNLPEYADVTWLLKVFGKFGKIDYISLPRNKYGCHSGYSFVEFSTSQECCKAREVHLIVQSSQASCSFDRFRHSNQKKL